MKRKDEIIARVVELLPDQGYMMLDWGGRTFGVSVPAFPVAVGQLVDVAHVGYCESDIPRHAVLTRVWMELE